MEIEKEEKVLKRRLPIEEEERCAYCGRVATFTEKLEPMFDVEGNSIELAPYHFCSTEHRNVYYSDLMTRREIETDWHARRRLFYTKKLINTGQFSSLTTLADTHLIGDLASVILVKLLDVLVDSFTRESPIACGANHTVLMGPGDYIYVTGDNSFGQLGIGREIASKLSTFTPIYMPGVCAIACGANFTLVLTRDAKTRKTKLWACGQNSRTGINGMLGFPANIDIVDRFTVVDRLDDVVMIRSSSYFPFVVCENGVVRDIGTRKKVNSKDKFVIDMSLNDYESIFLYDNNPIENSHGRILTSIGRFESRFKGVVPYANIVRVIALRSDNFMLIDIQGNAYITEKRHSNIIRFNIPTNDTIRSFAFSHGFTGNNSLIFVYDDGSICYENDIHEPEHKKEFLLGSVRHVALGSHHMFAMTVDGRLFVRGDKRPQVNVGVLGIVDTNGQAIEETGGEWLEVPYLPALVRTDNKKSRVDTKSMYSLLGRYLFMSTPIACHFCHNMTAHQNLLYHRESENLFCSVMCFDASVTK